MMKFTLMTKGFLIAVMVITLGMPSMSCGADRTEDSTWENEAALRKNISFGLQEEQLKKILDEKKADYFYISKEEMIRQGGESDFDPKEDIDGMYSLWGKRKSSPGGLLTTDILFTIYVKSGVVTRVHVKKFLTAP